MSIKKFNEFITESKEEKYFKVLDKSGRSSKPYLLDKTHIQNTWDLSEEDWDTEKTLGEFLDNCYIDDVWNTQDVKITCHSIK